jgi:transposase InsO family protein
VLTIIDTFSRYSPAIEPRFTFRGPDVVEILEEVGRQVAFPKAIWVDQDTEFVSCDLDLWAYQRGVMLDFSRPGKPTDNAFIESFNIVHCSTMRGENARLGVETTTRSASQRDRQKTPIELVVRSTARGPR